MARAAIITGASRGIGAAVAERLANDGLSVVVDYAGGEAEASALVNHDGEETTELASTLYVRVVSKRVWIGALGLWAALLD